MCGLATQCTHEPRDLSPETSPTDVKLSHTAKGKENILTHRLSPCWTCQGAAHSQWVVNKCFQTRGGRAGYTDRTGTEPGVAGLRLWFRLHHRLGCAPGKCLPLQQSCHLPRGQTPDMFS